MTLKKNKAVPACPLYYTTRIEKINCACVFSSKAKTNKETQKYKKKEKKKQAILRVM